MLLHPQGMAPRIINLDEWAWHVIDRLRQEVLNIPNGRLDALVNELEALVPDRPRQPGPAAALVHSGVVYGGSGLGLSSGCRPRLRVRYW